MFSSLQPTKKYFLITFLISCMLLEVFTLVIYHQSKINKNSRDWVIHSYEVLRIGRGVLIEAIDLADREQDYMLSGYPSNLKAYNTVLADLNAKLAELTKITADNPEQQGNLTLFRKKIDELKRISAGYIDTMRRGRTSVYSIKADVQAIKRATLDVRNAFDAFSKNETRLLTARVKNADNEQDNYLWTLFMGGILGLGALLIANLVIYLLITKSTRAEDKLRRSEELFSIILSGLNDGVYDSNVPAGTISYSPAYKTMLGYGDEEMEKLSNEHDCIYDFMHPDDIASAKEIVRQYYAREIPTYYNIFRLRHADGHWVWIMSRGIGIWDENGQIQRLVGAHTDITIQKQREEELNYFIQENERQREELAQAKEKAEAANQAKSDFLATMSHEIRTPMNAVVGLACLLLETPLGAKQREMVETLCVNADVLLRLVNDLLDLSRIESGQVEMEARSFTLDSVFKALHAMLDGPASAKGLTLSITNNAGDHTYIGDPTRIQQILANLIGNAIKFTSKGSIIVTAEGEAQDETHARMRIIVADTGVGIPADKLSSVFEKFVQADQTISRRFGGSGLGLAICKSLAQLMGGDITVASTPGEGSVFTFSLPLQIGKQKKAVAPVPGPVAAERTASRGTVLIVEDYAANIMVATMMLDLLGYAADTATTGTGAIRKIEAAKVPYTAILMDVQMQDMDGFEATRRIRAIEKQKGFQHFIIGVTAHALAGDREKCLQAGMDDYMSKPIHPDILAQKLGSLSRAA